MPTPLPRLRDRLHEEEDAEDPRYVLMSDPYRLTDQVLRVPRLTHAWIRMLDGQTTLQEIHARLTVFLRGQTLAVEQLEREVRLLDTAGFLENDAYFRKLHQPDRPPSCIGCYSADPAILHQQLDALFTDPLGPGLPGKPGCRIDQDGELSAVLVPHMDYGRGGVTYGYGFKELVERTRASLFFIIATSHYSPNRFTLTRQNFVTPLGRVETDQACVDALVNEYGDGLFDDPLAHFPEHSIELEVVLLQHLLGGHRTIRILPLLVGSFQDTIRANQAPSQQAEIAPMIQALRKVAHDAGEPVCFIISGDLAHIGPKFDDPEPVSDRQLEHSASQDRKILAALEGASPARYFRVIAEEKDRRRICGLPPTFLTLESLQPKRGKVLHYGRYVDPSGYESVSFAAAAFAG